MVVLFKIWIFDVENSNEFLASKEKLKLKEKGPYVYQCVFFELVFLQFFGTKKLK